MATYLDELLDLLDHVPMVTEEQAATYVAARFGESSLKSVYGCIYNADQKQIIWRDHFNDLDGAEVITVSSSKDKAQGYGAKLFPVAFWLYLALHQMDQICFTATMPMSATFTRRMKDGDDRIAQVAVYDLTQNKPAMVFSNEIVEDSKRALSPFCGNKSGQLAKAEIPGMYWRALVLLGAPNGYAQSREFEFLRGCGFTKFLITDSFVRPPELVFSEPDEMSAWHKILNAIP